MNIIPLLIAFIILIAMSSTIRENFSVRRQIRKRVTKPIKKHINSKIDILKNYISNFQNKYL